MAKPAGRLIRFIRDRPSLIVAAILSSMLAAVVLLFVRAFSTYEEVYRDYATSKAYADAQDEFSDKCLRASSVQEAVGCLSEAIKTARETQRAEEDLHAQKQMAVWAEMMFYATFFIGVVSIGIAVLSVFLIRRTLEAQRQATNAATKAVEVSTEGNRLNRDAFLADQRPWLRVDAAIDGPLRWIDGGCHFEFAFLIENTGRTPALNAFVNLDVLLEPGRMRFREEQEALADHETSRPSRVGFHVFPGQKVVRRWAWSRERVRVEAAMARLNAGEPMHPIIMPYLIGCVKYSSPLDNNYFETGFIYQITRIVEGRPNLLIGPSIGDLPAEQLALILWAESGRTT